MVDDKPRLRQDLDIVPVEVKGKPMFVVQDGLGLIQSPVVVSREMLAFMVMLDGENTRSVLQQALTRAQGGALVTDEQIDGYLADLDKALLLDTDRYHQARREIVDQFSRLTVRRSILAGRTFPEDKAALTTFVDGIIDMDVPTFKGDAGKITAVVSPHIDINVAERAYAAAFKPLRGAPFKRVIVLGVGHRMPSGLFCLTDQEFATPLGVVKKDKAFVATLQEAGGGVLAEDAFPHRDEHSIEIELVFLQRVLGTEVEMVPILCGGLAAILAGHARFSDIPDTAPFLSVLKEGLADPETLILAGVDFSHIGMKFGHEAPATTLESRAKEQDKVLLDALCRGDAMFFWRELQRVNDRYHVCGASALATLLEILPAGAGMVAAYDMWHENATQSAVSYASVIFSRA